MSRSEIDFSAQFGGRDAAGVALPHFKALKAATKNVVLRGFALPKLAFILRVDGEVNQYGLSGLGNPDVDRSQKYLSLDIGITIEDRERLGEKLADAILSSESLIAKVLIGVADIDRPALHHALAEVVEAYRRSIG